MHVLIAEDNDINQKLLQRTFQKIGGCTFAIVGDGQQALDYLASPPTTCPRPDLILMDTAMPVMSGLEATRIIRTQPPFATDAKLASTPIIALAPWAVRSDKERLAQQGFDDVLSKPIRLGHMGKMLLFWSRRRAVRRSGMPLSGRVVAIPPAAQWGPFPLRRFRGPRSLL
ncbi:CheY-like superfamily [Aspergillus egyptiacus]|nr:CheY-like superfamily [Aspergillus egyptiacus]